MRWPFKVLAGMLGCLFAIAGISAFIHQRPHRAAPDAEQPWDKPNYGHLTPKAEGVLPVARTIPDLQLQPGSKFLQGPYSGYITGKVQNNSGHAYRYAQISFNLYDRSGAQVGSAWANVSDLDAGGRWKFKAMCFHTEAATCRLKEITGF